MRTLPRDPPARPRHGHLLEPEPQAEAGLEWHASPESTLPTRSGSRSGSPTSTGSASRRRTICAALGLSPDEKIQDLTDDEITKLRNYIDTDLQVEVTCAASASR